MNPRLQTPQAVGNSGENLGTRRSLGQVLTKITNKNFFSHVNHHALAAPTPPSLGEAVSRRGRGWDGRKQNRRLAFKRYEVSFQASKPKHTDLLWVCVFPFQAGRIEFEEGAERLREGNKTHCGEALTLL